MNLFARLRSAWRAGVGAVQDDWWHTRARPASGMVFSYHDVVISALRPGDNLTRNNMLLERLGAAPLDGYDEDDAE